MQIEQEANSNTHFAGPDEGASLDKVRDILFGAQARDIEKRFAQLEAQLLQKTNEARDESHRRLEALEAQLKHEAGKLQERILAENADRNQTIRGLADELRSLTQQLDEKINQLDDKALRANNALHEQLVSHARQLAGEIEGRTSALSSVLQQEVKTLGFDKLNRGDIAAMFQEMAHRFINGKAE